MEPQFIISIAVGVAAFVVGLVGRWYLFLGFALIFVSIVAGRLAYPDEMQDALWFIGAVLALMIDTTAIVVGLLTGWLCRRLVLRHRAKRSAGAAGRSD